MTKLKVNTDYILSACDFLSDKERELRSLTDSIYDVCYALDEETPLREVIKAIRNRANALDECAYLTKKMSDALEDIQKLYVDYEKHIKNVSNI
ncbi:MAG: hypothetical protein II998_09935 [Clostridia bacterium]|nr:hypothetical protein [Clostridia bacterium]